MAELDIITKRCPACGEIKPREAFHIARKRYDGLQPNCRRCIAEWRGANKAKISANNAAYRRAHRDALIAYATAWRTAYPDKAKLSAAAWRKANAEALRNDGRLYRRANRGRYATNIRAWQKVNPDRVAGYRHTRRARKYGAGGKLSAADIRDIRRMQRDRCAACRCPLGGRGTIDHIVALAKGGTNDRRNAQLMCKPCNSSKRSTDPIDFMRSRGFLL